MKLPQTTDLLLLLAAVPAAAWGGDMFLRGVVGIAAGLRVPRLLVATTLAAFATSSPELSVSVLAAASGRPGIGLGDALGSNVVNVGLVLGTALLLGPLAVAPRELRRDALLALAVPALTLLLARDGTLSRADGALLLALFLIWFGWLMRLALGHRRRTRDDAAAAPPRATVMALLQLPAGLAGLLAAGRLFVAGASGIATSLGVHPYVIGATLVSAGTSLPEWVTMLLARRRGDDDIGIGTLLGSNLFNGLAVVGLAASIHPIRTSQQEIGVAVGFGLLTLALMLPRGGALSRRRGVALLLAWAAFIAITAVAA
jgi:cation:H+ antiporter